MPNDKHPAAAAWDAWTESGWGGYCKSDIPDLRNRLWMAFEAGWIAATKAANRSDDNATR